MEDYMRASFAGVLVVTLLFGFIVNSASLAQAQSAATKEVVGTWRLVSAKSTSGNEVKNMFGEHPGGYIGFTASRFWVMLVDTDRKAPAGAVLTDSEALSMMKTSAAYTGKYDADQAPTSEGIKAVIHVDAAAQQALAGTDRVFFVRVEGNRLTLKSPSVFVPMTGLTSAVQLEFVKVE
jgi:hypothetical protein